MPRHGLGVRGRWLRFLVFLSVMIALVGGAHVYLYRRLVVAPALAEPWTSLGGIVLTACAIATPTGLIAARRFPAPVGRVLGRFAFVWMGLSFLLLTMLGLSELVRLAVAPQLGELTTSRGIAGAVVALGVAATLAGVRSALGPVPVREVDVHLERLDPSLDGYRIVQLSDVHIGPTLGRDWLQRVVDRVNALEADAIVITGDLVDGSVLQLRDDVAPLAELTARDGVFFVTGNHEYYSGADAWLAELRRLGVRPLRNERVRLPGDGGPTFDLAGVDDWNAFGDGHGRDLDGALEGRDPATPVVLLAHQPRQWPESVERGVDLQLSGHTHGGQIIPWNLLVRLQQPAVAGLDRRGESQLYTSRGTGFWGPPIRVGAPPEISCIALRAPA